jgi:hypothetical protein
MLYAKYCFSFLSCTLFFSLSKSWLRLSSTKDWFFKTSPAWYLCIKIKNSLSRKCNKTLPHYLYQLWSICFQRKKCSWKYANSCIVYQTVLLYCSIQLRLKHKNVLNPREKNIRHIITNRYDLQIAIEMSQVLPEDSSLKLYVPCPDSAQRITNIMLR